MSFIAPRMGELLQICSVRVNGKDLKETVDPAHECDLVPAWRPDGKVVVVFGQHLFRVVLETLHPQPFAIGSLGAVHDVLAVGRKGSERIVVRPRGYEVKAGA